jgi:hypothetical protein
MVLWVDETIIFLYINIGSSFNEMIIIDRDHLYRTTSLSIVLVAHVVRFSSLSTLHPRRKKGATQGGGDF